MTKIPHDFVFQPASDPGYLDDEYVRITKPSVTIQVSPYCPRPYQVHEWHEDEEAQYHHGEFTTLEAAFEAARKL